MNHAPAYAHRWLINGDHPDDGPPGQEGKVVRYFRHPDYEGFRACPRCHQEIHAHGWIDTGDTGLTVCPGDWIVTTPSGQHIPVDDLAFRTLWRPE